MPRSDKPSRPAAPKRPLPPKLRRFEPTRPVDPRAALRPVPRNVAANRRGGGHRV